MNFWQRMTGGDMKKELAAFEARAKKLPDDYRAAWERIKAELWPHSDLTGRNVVPVLDGVLGLLEETAADGQSVREALGEDIAGFCAALMGKEGAASYRDRWRRQLNDNIARKLGK